jgi:hypothetical protein
VEGLGGCGVGWDDDFLLRSVFGIVHWRSCDGNQADWDLDISVFCDFFR